MADGQEPLRGPTDLRFRTTPEWTDTQDPAYAKMLHVLDESLGDLKALGAAFGPSYQWSIGGRRRQRARSVSERNAIYWEECGDQWIGLAYARLAKSEQLVTAALSSMDRGHLVPAAACVRTLLEQAVVFEHLGKTFCETVQDMLERGINPKKDLIERPDLLQLLHLARYGTRVPEYLALGYPQQTNFLSYFQKWSKLRTGPKPDFVYHHLCDMVHPNLESELSVYRSRERTRSGKETVSIRLGPGHPVWAQGAIVIVAGLAIAVRHLAHDMHYVGVKALEAIAFGRGDFEGKAYHFPREDPRARLMIALGRIEMKNG